MDRARKGYRRRVGWKVGRGDSGVLAVCEDEVGEPCSFGLCVIGVVGLDQSVVEALPVSGPTDPGASDLGRIRGHHATKTPNYGPVHVIEDAVVDEFAVFHPAA